MLRNSCFVRVLDNGKVLIKDNDLNISDVVDDVETALSKLEIKLNEKTQQTKGDSNE